MAVTNWAILTSRISTSHEEHGMESRRQAHGGRGNPPLRNDRHRSLTSAKPTSG